MNSLAAELQAIGALVVAKEIGKSAKHLQLKHLCSMDGRCGMGESFLTPRRVDSLVVDVPYARPIL
jgi:hypothetical protein